MTVRVRVTDTGRRAGAEVAQVYVRGPASTGEPPENLVAFTKVWLDPGHNTTLTFTLPSRAFSYRNTSNQRWTIAPGRYQIMTGGSSRDIRLTSSVLLDG